MLFNSYAFLFLFLPPVAFLAFYFSHLRRQEARILLLIAASLIFYATWNLRFLVVLLISVAGNYLGGEWMRRSEARHRTRRLIVLISINIAAWLYFKNQPWVLLRLGRVLGFNAGTLDIGFPLAISFFTFQQLAYLLDLYYSRRVQGKVRFADYSLFVTFFPHLIAGPIVHHSDMIPQFRRRRGLSVTRRSLAVGLSVFVIGLVKKTLFADVIVQVPDRVFAAASAGHAPSLSAAILAAVGFTLQIYFDFSGYSDMAIGLARIFGVRMPLNFNSPYKAVDIVDFWRRWHMTLTRFFTDYVYTPWALVQTRANVAVSRSPVPSFVLAVFAPTIGTFVLVGLWHGIGPTFLVFGILQGIALTLARAWRQLDLPQVPAVFGWSLTMSFFVVSLVIFRAPDLASAQLVLGAMVGHGGAATPLPPLTALCALFLGIGTCLFLPNTAELLHRFLPLIEGTDRMLGQRLIGAAEKLKWRPTLSWAVLAGLGLVFVIVNLTVSHPFVYMQF